MATLSTETYVRKDGTESTTYRVLIGGGKRQRQTIRLGDVSERVAKEAKARIEALETARVTGTAIDRTTAAWLDAIGDEIHEKLARVGLVEPREPVPEGEPDRPLLELVERYISSRASLKPNTIRNYETTKRLLVEHFGKERLVGSIHAGHARDYREWLVGKYAAATVAREIKRARQFFEYAKDCRIIDGNAFAKIKAGSQSNPKRKHFVERPVIDKVLAACPDNDWRLVVVLARYGGLRIPSELERLKWSDIDWHGRRFTVRDTPKKERLVANATRVVPIFPEIEPYLRQAFDEAPEGSIYVLPRRFHNEGYAYAGVLRAIERASVKPWPKLFVNCRATRETELKREYPDHVVYAWIGHTEQVALEHYLMVTDGDFERAAALPTGSGERSNSPPPVYPAQNPAQREAVLSRQATADQEKEPVSLAFAGDTSSAVPPRGVEESGVFTENVGAYENGDTISDTVCLRKATARNPEPRTHLDSLPAGVRNELRGLTADTVSRIRELLVTLEAERQRS